MKDGVVRTGYPAEKVVVIPNSSDLELFDPEKTDGNDFLSEYHELNEAPLVVYAGAMGIINGVEYLAHIAAASRKCAQRIKFAVFGHKGQGEQKVRNAALDLNVLNKNFHMYPSVPKKEMAQILKAADVALSLFIDLKPMWNNSANKFFDSLASGTPVAINYGGWQADLLRETGAGIILPPNDPDEAARRLGDFMADKDRLQKAGKAARKLAEERFSRDDLASQLESVLLDAAGRP